MDIRLVTFPDGLYLSEIHVTAKGNPSKPFDWPMMLKDGVWHIRRLGWFRSFVWEEIK